MEERVWQAKKAKKQKYKVLSQIVTVALVIVKGSRFGEILSHSKW